MCSLLNSFFKFIIDNPLVMNFGTGTYKSSIYTFGRISRLSYTQNPPVFAIVSPQSVFYPEGFLDNKSTVINFQETFLVNFIYTFNPPISHFLFNGSARISQPGLVKKISLCIRACYPDHDGCIIRHFPEQF